MKSFKGKVAVVTGAASGIGRALAVYCAQKEMKIVLADMTVCLRQPIDPLRRRAKREAGRE